MHKKDEQVLGRKELHYIIVIGERSNASNEERKFFKNHIPRHTIVRFMEFGVLITCKWEYSCNTLLRNVPLVCWFIGASIEVDLHYTIKGGMLYS